MTKILVLLIASCLVGTWAEKCPQLKVDKNFENEQITGTWYEQFKYSNKNWENVKCIVVQYDQSDRGFTWLQMRGFYEGGEKTEKYERAILTMPNKSQPGKFKMTFPEHKEVKPVDYFVLYANKELAIVAAYNNLGKTCHKHAWILTRESNPPNDLFTRAMFYAKQHGIVYTNFIQTNQKGCN